MGRLIDADDLKMALQYDASYGYCCEHIDGSDVGYSQKELLCCIDCQPTVDAVPVVRCYECKNLEMINNEGVFAKCNKHNMLFLLWEDDIREKFCSWGEAREDGKID